MYRSGNYFISKMNGHMNLMWRARYGAITGLRSEPASIAHAVAVDKNGNIVVTGGAGTLKYDPDGRVQWESPETGSTLHLDRFGNVILLKSVARDDGIYQPELVKFNADGTSRWRTRFHDRSPYDNSAAGLVTDEAGHIYFCTQNGEQSTIVKFVERGHLKE